MINELLIELTNSVLGSGKRTARGNQSYSCPFCKHPTPKLEVNFTKTKEGFHYWHCWHCDVKGKKIGLLFKKLGVSNEIKQELKKIVEFEGDYQESIPSVAVALPKEFKPLIGDTSNWAKQAKAYLKSRNIDKDDVEKYNMGYCDRGPYSKMIIVPSYDSEGKLNYFTGRSFEKEPYSKYKNPQASRDIIPFELFINWDVPLIICEGPFDALAIKRNAIPLFGKNIQTSLMKKIVTSKVKKIYIALDSDAMNRSLKYVEKFMNEGKEVYLVDIEDKDPSDLGFTEFTKLIQSVVPLTLSGLMRKKISIL